ncbi:MAG: alpha/beta hydrolase fold domain-containing protein [Porphyrobacter sp.]|nr:alpha/beta hydrolase fold domain-containing protein [Porphyrobacter sp.]
MGLRHAGCLGLLAAALSGCAPMAQAQATGESTPAAAPQERAPALLAYKTVPKRQLFLHVFSPDPAVFPGARPAILFFHGGGWVEGDAARFYDQAQHLADKGMVAVSADYRIAGRDGSDPRAALADAFSAMRYLRAHAAALLIDPARIAAGGGSAGGQLAAALATVADMDDPGDDARTSVRPAALVLFNPVIDNGPGGYGYERVAAYWKDFSPLHNIGPGHPPTLIMLGTKDALVPVATGQTYCDKVRAVGGACRLELYEGQPHAFFARNVSPRYYRETLAAMDDFLAALGFIAAPDG